MFGDQTSSSTFRSCRLNENILFIFIEPYPESQFKHFVREIDRHIGIDETIPTNARILDPRTARLSFWTVGFRHNPQRARLPNDKLSAILESLGTELIC